MIYVQPFETANSLDLSDALIIAVLADGGTTITPADCAEVRRLIDEQARLPATDWDNYGAIFDQIRAKPEWYAIDYLLSYGFGPIDSDTAHYVRSQGHDLDCGSMSGPDAVRALLHHQGLHLSESTLALIPGIKWG